MSSFTDGERESIRRYLGYPAAEGYISQILVSCNRLEATAPAAVDTVKSLLRELGTIQREISNARPYSDRTFQSNAGGTTQFVPGQRLDSLKSEAKRLVNEASTALQLQIFQDIYAGGGAGWGFSPVGR
ncbi:MAG: hypothetical protein F6K04_01365 [Leptolyngbya sp. SIO4C5]|nr:hypothetical protein [Leptolyngbya sp. SIO4C5]